MLFRSSTEQRYPESVCKKGFELLHHGRRSNDTIQWRYIAQQRHAILLE